MTEGLTVEVLKYYVPVFQRGDKALLRLLSGEEMDELERNVLETQVKVREIALNRLISLARPLIVVEVHKMIKNSLLKDEADIFDLIFYAGVGGMVKGLRKFDVEKIEKSATNYIFQWITTYAKKELLAAEARPFAIPPSRFYKYKKISAVRKKMAEALQRQPTNEEVLAYFHDGFADVNTMNGPVLKGRRSAANQAITLELVEEQDLFEKNMKKVISLEVDDFRNDLLLSVNDENDSGVIQLFVEATPDLTDKAKEYIYSELGIARNQNLSLSKSEYRKLGNQWAALLRDRNGPFYRFLKESTEDKELLDMFSDDYGPLKNYDDLFRS